MRCLRKQLLSRSIIPETAPCSFPFHGKREGGTVRNRPVYARLKDYFGCQIACRWSHWRFPSRGLSNSDFSRAILGTIEWGWPRTLANKSAANASPTTEFPFVDNGWFHGPTLFRWLLHLVRNRRNVEQPKDEITRDYRRSIFAGTESAVLVSADRKY